MRLKLFISIIAGAMLFCSCEKDDSDQDSTFGNTIISLKDITVTSDGNVELKWSTNNDSISYYNIIRIIGTEIDPYNSMIIASVDKKTLSYIDTDVPYTSAVTYLIQGMIPKQNNPYYYKTTASNSKTYIRDISMIKFPANDVLFQKELSKLFLINRTNGKVKAYNYKTKEETNIDFFSAVGFCSLNKNGLRYELVVPREDGWLFIYNADTFEFIEQIKVSASSLSSSVINGDLIFTNTKSSYEPVKVIRRSTKSVMSSLTWYGDDNRKLEIIPNSNTELFGVNANDISYYQYDINGTLTSRLYKSVYNSEYNVSTRYAILPNSKKFISAPLGNIYDASIAYVTGLPRGSFTFSDFIINTNGSKVYASCSNHKSIEVYNLNDYLHTETIQTKGYPYRIFYDNGEIIVVSISSSTSSNYYYDTNSNINEFIIEKIAHTID